MMQYVIERMDGGRREWWTCDDVWSDIDMDAQWYNSVADADEVVSRIGEGVSVGYQVGEEV